MLTHLPMGIWTLRLGYIRCIHIERFLYGIPQFDLESGCYLVVEQGNVDFDPELHFSDEQDGTCKVVSNKQQCIHDLDTFLLSSFIQELGMHENDIENLAEGTNTTA